MIFVMETCYVYCAVGTERDTLI